LPGGAKLDLVEIPAGSFCMGSENGPPDEKPPHKVTFRQSFYIGKYEVTQDQWQKLMGNNPSSFSDCGNCPVEQVSWDDAQRFIVKLNQLNDGFGYRLPSEAEWEYACRAGTTGDYAGNLTAMAWYSDNAGNKTHPVGQKQANAFGLFDMHGNVNEWCEDWYHLNLAYRGAPTDGNVWESRGGQATRVLRGGSWRNNATNQRSSARGKSEPGLRLNLIGLRVVATPLR
jgi:formylglycine-generating enzyme required for sulfatase activity